MASTSASSAPTEGGPDPSIAHLPDASEELGRTADLTIIVEGQELKLHSAVAAVGSRVLRTALCSCDSGTSTCGGGAAAAAAVQAAFEGCKLTDVQLFLKLLYNPAGLESGLVGCESVATPDSWSGVLCLADKLDAEIMLQACDTYVTRHLGRPATDWMGWLLLADKLQLKRIAAHCAKSLVNKMVQGAAPQDVARLAQLGQPAAQVLFAVLLKGVRSAVTCNASVVSHVSSCLPSNVDWEAPQNLF